MRLAKRPRLSRRSWLWGSGGAVISLPWLEAMIPEVGAQALPSPTRFLKLFVGLSTHDPALIAPSTLGPGYALSPALLPLGDVQSDVSVISELHMPTSGAGSWAGKWHCNNVGPLLSGVSTGGEDRQKSPIPKGPTSDQLVADRLAGNARFRSLELRVQPEVYRENNEAHGTISYKLGAAGLEPNTPQASPTQAFKSLFGGATVGAAEDPALMQRLAQGRSVLDLVSQRSGALMARLGASDQQRLQRHFDEVRGLETRLSGIGELSGAGCHPPQAPTADPGVTSGVATNPVGDARIVGFGDEDARALVMTDLLHMALACDLARTATLAYTFSQCFIDSVLLLGRGAKDLHELSHGAGTPEDVAASLAWPVGHFARLVRLMKETPEGDGNLLTHSALVLLFEGGGNGGDPHSGERMVALTAGTAGGLAAGVHLNAAQAHPASVLISAMLATGHQGDQLGEIQGGVPGLVV